MKHTRTVILDNEPVQALVDPHHRKHRRVLAHVQFLAARNRRQAGAMKLVVPTAVRVEAGWDRQLPGAAQLNQLRITDAVLDETRANVAARVRSAVDVSVADAHIAAVIQATDGPQAVVTSDVDDLNRIVAHLDGEVRVVAI